MDFDNHEETPTDLRDVRPSSFSHVIGQEHVKQALQIAVDASFQEGKRLDEILLCGPPGLGKSAIVQVLADEMCCPFREVLAQSVTNAAELNSVLLSASEGILFLDEIHLLNAVQQHALLQVLDKRRIFLSGGKAVQSIPVAPFTLIGATTDQDGLISPLVWITSNKSMSVCSVLRASVSTCWPRCWASARKSSQPPSSRTCCGRGWW